MASGNTLWVLTPLNCTPPSANVATHDTVSDASTPNIIIPVLDFDGATDEFMNWIVTVPSQYGETTGLTFSYKYAMDGTDGDIIELEFRALHIDDQTVLTGDLGLDGQTPTTIADDPDATANDFNYSTTGTMAKANFGSASPSDLLCIQAMRDISVAANANDLQLVEIYVKET